MDGFVDRLHALRFLRACDPSYGALTFTLVGLPPTGYISLLLDILFGSFLPSLWSSSNQSVHRSREPTLLCNHVVFGHFHLSDFGVYRELTEENKRARGLPPQGLLLHGRAVSPGERYGIPLLHLAGTRRG